MTLALTAGMGILMIVMTVHGGILSAPDKHKKWFLIYGISGILLVFAQGYYQHRDDTAVRASEADLRNQIKNLSGQITTLVNASRIQATADDIRNIELSLANGFKSVTEALKSCFKGKPPVTVQVPSPQPSVPPAPTVEHIQITQRAAVSNTPDAPYGWQVIMQANDTIQPVAFRVDCDAPIQTANQFIAGQSAYMSVAESYSADRKSYTFSFQYPPLTPMAPLVVTVYSKQPIHIVKIERMHP